MIVNAKTRIKRVLMVAESWEIIDAHNQIFGTEILHSELAHMKPEQVQEMNARLLTEIDAMPEEQAKQWLERLDLQEF